MSSVLSRQLVKRAFGFSECYADLLYRGFDLADRGDYADGCKRWHDPHGHADANVSVVAEGQRKDGEQAAEADTVRPCTLLDEEPLTVTPKRRHFSPFLVW